MALSSETDAQEKRRESQGAKGIESGSMTSNSMKEVNNEIPVVPAEKEEIMPEETIPSVDPNDSENYLPFGTQLALITFSLMLAVFCVALDNTIIAIAIPRITDDFHDLNDVGWYASAYLLTSCCM